MQTLNQFLPGSGNSSFCFKYVMCEICARALRWLKKIVMKTKL